MTVDLDAAVNPKSRPAVVVTLNPAVYSGMRATLKQAGALQVVHASPLQLLALQKPVFWVIDAMVPDAGDLIEQLMNLDRRDGLVLTNALLRVFNRFCLSVGVQAMLLHSKVEAPPETPVIHLTARETQIVALVARGLTNDQVGEELGLSGLTVKSHLARLMRRTNSKDRAHLVAKALRARLLPA